ncbi:MAG: hypothetical protein AB2L20_21985 [Mangrovibacterium sp.]
MKQNKITRRDALKKLGMVSGIVTCSSVIGLETSGIASKKEANDADRNENEPIYDLVCQDHKYRKGCVSIYSSTFY